MFALFAIPLVIVQCRALTPGTAFLRFGVHICAFFDVKPIYL